MIVPDIYAISEHEFDMTPDDLDNTRIDLAPKYIEKIKRLKEQGYIECVGLLEEGNAGNVWYLPHFSTQQAKFWGSI